VLGFLLFVLNKTLFAEKNVNCWKMSPYPLEVMNPGKLFLLSAAFGLREMGG
jgi:hypothetical protein